MADPTAQDQSMRDLTAADFAPSTGPAPVPAPGPPMAGAAADAIFSSRQSLSAHVLNAVGFGIQQEWGAQPTADNPEFASAMQKAGFYDDYKNGKTNIIKQFNEAVIRASATLYDMGTRTLATPFIAAAAAGGATEETEQQPGYKNTPDQNIANFGVKAVGEIGQGVLSGFGGEFPGLQAEGEAGAIPERPAPPEPLREISQARSSGVVGEGEAGFYDAEPIKPENVQARTEAAQSVGETAPPPPQPPTPDIHALARRIDPDTFEPYDALALERDAARDDLARLATEREARPEAIEAKEALHAELGLEPGEDLGGQTLDERVEAVASSTSEAGLDRLRGAYDRYGALLNEDSPEMTEARNRLLDADMKMRELAPAVSDAYRKAQEIAPNLPEQIAVEEPKPGEEGAKPGEENPGQAEEAPTPGQPGENHLEVVPAIGKDADAEMAPPSVTGEQKLGAPETEPPAKNDQVPEKEAPIGFTTAKGSTYELHEDGTTTRNKAARNDAGHEGDSGPKERSTKTIYANSPEEASRLSAAGVSNLGPKGARVIIRDGKASLLTWNEKAGKWGISPSSRDIPISDEAGVGKAPLELWKKADDVPGHEAYRGMHAGNAIVEMKAALKAERAEGLPPVPKTRTTSALKGIEGSDELGVRRVAERSEENAIAAGLSETMGDLPTYGVLKDTDQAAIVTDLMNKDPERAKAIAMGTREPPKGATPEAFLIGVENRALAEGDFDTAYALKDSKLAKAGTTMGQRLSTYRTRTKSSPIDAIQEVQAAREADLAKRMDVAAAKRDTVAEIKGEMRSAASKPAAWKDFLDGLKCSE